MLAFLVSLFGAISSIEKLAVFFDSLASAWAAHRKAEESQDIDDAKKAVADSQTDEDLIKAGKKEHDATTGL